MVNACTRHLLIYRNRRNQCLAVITYAVLVQQSLQLLSALAGQLLLLPALPLPLLSAITATAADDHSVCPATVVQDRVETSPEQMAACTALAESISSSSGLYTRVVGWYHSHPHITVLPSHVDVATQV